MRLPLRRFILAPAQRRVAYCCPQCSSANWFDLGQVLPLLAACWRCGERLGWQTAPVAEGELSA